MKAPSRGPSGPIDWKRVRELLARAIQATEEATTLSPERARSVMEERARVLARVPPEPPRTAEILEVAIFVLGAERYAIETRYVREIVRLADFTPVPGAPDFVVGVMSLRGEILAVIDLRRFLGVPVAGLTDLSRVVVLGPEPAAFGVLADQTREVSTLRIEEVLEPPETVAGVGREYLRGVTGNALIVLDGAALLGDPRLFINQAETAGGSPAQRGAP
jgi:purine-binding chemotaxis protein CheW